MRVERGGGEWENEEKVAEERGVGRERISRLLLSVLQ